MRRWPTLALIASLYLAGSFQAVAAAAQSPSQGSASKPAAQAVGTSAPSWYRIGPKDVVQISVPEIPELNISRRVSDDGTISLPLIGDFKVGDLTTTQASERLKQLLEAKYVQRATVDIEISEFRSNPISVIGAVRNPGPLPYPGHWTLIEALTAAGGLDASHGGVVYVLRRAPNGLSDQLTIPLSDLMIRGKPEDNIPVFAN
ncbi:MAG TPA: polysaccharide biosynthesis/export family protein, partial [Thermoanaerobaculia bacterium]|nr:polysaccharide biosynthesis/export family protein [Thermoanaerobaculia bacterium]